MADNEPQRVALARAIKEAMDNWAGHVEIIKYKAKVAKARYDALRREGFGPAEAMHLCTKDVEL